MPQDQITPFFDAHTHVQFSGYDADRGAVIRRATGASVRMVNVGTQKDTSRAAVGLPRNIRETLRGRRASPHPHGKVVSRCR